MINRFNTIFRSSLEPLHQALEEHLLPRYRQLEYSEQKIILLAAIILPLVIIIFAVMLPLQDTQKALQKELYLTQGKAAEAKRLANYLSKHGMALKAGNSSESLLTSIERMARQSKVRNYISRIKPQSSPNTAQQQLMLRLKNVPYSAALSFIHALAEQKMSIKSMKLQSTKTPGIVNLHAIIKRT